MITQPFQHAHKHSSPLQWVLHTNSQAKKSIECFFYWSVGWFHHCFTQPHESATRKATTKFCMLHHRNMPLLCLTKMCLRGMAYSFTAPSTLWTGSPVCYLTWITYWSSPQLHLTLLCDLISPWFISPFLLSPFHFVCCAPWVTVSLTIAHLFPNYHPIPVMLLFLSRFL